MPRSTTLIAPAGLLGLLIFTTQLQAEPPAKPAVDIATDITTQLSADGQEAQPQQENPDSSMDTTQQRDAMARKKAKEIIMQMEKKLGTQ